MGTVTSPSFWSTGYVTVDSDILSSPDMLASVRESLILNCTVTISKIRTLRNFHKV